MKKTDLGRWRWLLVLAAGGLVRLGCATALASQRRGRAGAAARAAPRGVPVDVATAVKKKVPVRLEALGTVTTIASVAIKPRVDSEIIGVHFDDGARVKQGDLLFTLDSRADRGGDQAGRRRSSRGAKAQLEQAPSATSQRYTELVAKNATTAGHAQQRADPGQHLRAPRRSPTRRRWRT